MLRMGFREECCMQWVLLRHMMRRSNGKGKSADYWPAVAMTPDDSDTAAAPAYA